MNLDNFKNEITSLKDGVLSVMNQMKEQKAGKFGDNIPPCDLGFDVAYNLLTKPDFNLVVSGEVNRGKSTFINAIIGRDILPTYDRETTSQVFKITNSEKESFYIVFDNGDTKQIDKSDLAKVGSQVDANKGNSLDFGNKRIAYIQVNTPIDFLPEGVTIVDTPGIGSTYKSHSEITKGFMQYADAVIYLCSAKKPLEKTDIDFIQNSVLSLDTVPSILFVMSKADEADSEGALKAQIKRCEELIQEKFSDNQLVNKLVFPVISTSLIEANKTEDDEWKRIYYETSHFEQIKEEIQSIILKTKGFAWTLNAYNECVRYYKKVSNALSQQIELFNQTSTARQGALEAIEANKAKFMATMGITRQNEILSKITEILNAVKPDMKAECSTNGEIYKKYIDKINTDVLLNSTQEEINQYANDLQENIIDDITKRWEQLCYVTNTRVSELLQQYGSECGEFAKQTYTINRISVNDADISVSPTNKEYIAGIRNQYFTAFFVANIALYAGSLVFGPVGPILITIVNIGTLLYGIFGGGKEAKERALKKTKQDLTNHVLKVIQEIDKQLFKVSVLDGKYTCMVDAFVKSMSQLSKTVLTEAYNKCEAELKDNEQKIKDTIASTDPNLKTILVNLKTFWNESATKLKSYGEDIKKISDSLFAK